MEKIHPVLEVFEFKTFFHIFKSKLDYFSSLDEKSLHAKLKDKQYSVSSVYESFSRQLFFYASTYTKIAQANISGTLGSIRQYQESIQQSVHSARHSAHSLRGGQDLIGGTTRYYRMIQIIANLFGLHEILIHKTIDSAPQILNIKNVTIHVDDTVAKVEASSVKVRESLEILIHEYIERFVIDAKQELNSIITKNLDISFNKWKKKLGLVPDTVLRPIVHSIYDKCDPIINNLIIDLTEKLVQFFQTTLLGKLLGSILDKDFLPVLKRKFHEKYEPYVSK